MNKQIAEQRKRIDEPPKAKPEAKPATAAEPSPEEAKRLAEKNSLADSFSAPDKAGG